jgi:hypothetical protein
VGARTALAALAALLRDVRVGYRLRDYGHCSRRHTRDSSQLFVVRIGSERNRRDDGWFYKVNDRAPEIGAADPSGPRLRAGDRLLWFYCFFNDAERSCQRSLRVLPGPRPAMGRPFRVRVRGYDNSGRPVAVQGATVRLGAVATVSGPGGVAELSPAQRGTQPLSAAKPGAIPSFPVEVEVR